MIVITYNDVGSVPSKDQDGNGKDGSVSCPHAWVVGWMGAWMMTCATGCVIMIGITHSDDGLVPARPRWPWPPCRVKRVPCPVPTQLSLAADQLAKARADPAGQDQRLVSEQQK